MQAIQLPDGGFGSPGPILTPAFCAQCGSRLTDTLKQSGYDRWEGHAAFRLRRTCPRRLGWLSFHERTPWYSLARVDKDGFLL